MTIHIINYRYLSVDLSEKTVGGIQTYIDNLCLINKLNGFNTKIYQIASYNKEVDYDNCTVVGIQCKTSKLSKNAIKKVKGKELVIFATEELIIKYDGPSIAIQHGIYWDRPNISVQNKILNNLYTFRRARQAYSKICQMEYANKIVCVDYNFINWYRSQVAFPSLNTIAIPNFTEIPKLIEKPKGVINIIFARRFMRFRGTRVFVKAIIPILEKCQNISVTLAGEGPEEQYLRDRLEKFSNVKFIKYSSNESLNVHEKMHIAIIPTTGSEGTSLSLLEAMASQCAVICTDVGGMTNVVLDGYNGLMVKAGDSKQLEMAIYGLLEDEEQRMQLAENAYKTVKQSFSLECWKNKWSKLILESLEG